VFLFWVSPSTKNLARLTREFCSKGVAGHYLIEFLLKIIKKLP